MDAFFASIEQRDDPSLRGKPVLVGGSPERRGVVAACSYEARTFGIHSAMPMRTAVSRCPQAKVVPPRFERYREASQQIMAILRSVSPLVEPASLDEAYVDVTEAAARTSARELATSIKQRVKDQVGLTISIGIATSKSVAKIASDFDKPDGLFLVKRGDEAGFLAPLPVRALSGIGPKTQEQLQARGIQTLGQLANQSEDWLHEHFGKRGPELGERSRGIDHRPVTVERGDDLPARHRGCGEVGGAAITLVFTRRGPDPTSRHWRQDGDLEAAPRGLLHLHAESYRADAYPRGMGY